MAKDEQGRQMAKAERLSEALRANLRRRKAASRGKVDNAEKPDEGKKR